MDEELTQDDLLMTEAPPRRSRAVAAADDDLEDVAERPALAVEAFVRGVAPDMLPGASQRLLKQYGSGTQNGGLRTLVNDLFDPGTCEKYMDPEKSQPNIAPLRQMVRRFEHSGLLQKGAADELYDEIAIQIDPRLMRTDPGQVAVKIWDLLHDQTPGHRMLWREESRPPLAHRQARVAQALDALGVSFAPTRTEEFVHRHKDAAEGNRPFAEIVRIIAYRLGQDGIQVRPETVAAAISSANPGPGREEFRASFARSAGYEPL